MTAAARFHIKAADLSTILPTAVGPVVGGLAGRAIGRQYPALGTELGTILGGMSGNIGGQLIKEKVEGNQVPPGAPYALDPTAADIPPWALQGAQLVQPLLKQSGHTADVIGGDLGGLAWPVAQGIHQKRSVGNIARDVAGQGLGTLGGGLLGEGAGHVVDTLVGHQVRPMGIPLSTLLAGLGATIGNVKGRELALR